MRRVTSSGYSADRRVRRHRRRRHHAADGADESDRERGGRRQMNCRGRPRRTTWRDRLPGRAMPGRRLHDLRSGRDPDRDDVQRHRARRRARRTGIACARSTRQGTWARTASIVNATTPAAPDTTPPTAPTNLAGTAVSSSQINLTWTASTDNVGVTGYRVERARAQLHQLRPGRPRQPGRLQRQRVGANTTYRYRVRAVDAAGNLGAVQRDRPSRRRWRADTTPPSAPTNLVATAAGPSQVDLSWTASTDNVGVTGYRVERCQGAGCTTFAQVGNADRARASATRG